MLRARKPKYTLNFVFFVFFLALGGSFLTGSTANAVQLDWSGQFWFDHHWLHNYQLETGRVGYDADPVLFNAGGPYVPGTGEKSAMWFGAFLRLKPKVIVNDSIQIRSEWHVGSPIYGFMGRDFPTSGGEQYNFTGSQKNGAAITAARFWASLITDFGTIELGRAPIHWALGAIWNSGDNLFDRYQSSGDMVRVTSKFGNFSVSPAISKVAIGNSVSGALDTAATTAAFPGLANPKPGTDDVTDYHVALRYDNTEEDFDFGLMWTRRTGNKAQSSIVFSPTNTGSGRLNFNLLDFYARKRLGKFTFGLEVPFYTGTIGGIDGSANDFEYRAVAAVLEAGYSSDSWDILLKGGHIPGQPNVNPGRDPNGSINQFIEGGSKYRAVYLHKNYRIGLIMFKYNLWGLAANNPDTLTATQIRSPYDNPIVNANYISISPTYKLDKWSFHSTVVAAWASVTIPNNPAGGANGTDPKKFYNHQRRLFYTTAPGNGDQSSFMGWEVDLGSTFKWDDNFSIDWTVGMFKPGPFFEYGNTRPTDPAQVRTSGFLFASQIQAGITF